MKSGAWAVVWLCLCGARVASAQGTGLWAWAGVQPTERTAAFGADVGTRTATGRALEVGWRGTWGGVTARLLDTDFGRGGATDRTAGAAGGGQVALGELRATVGPRGLAADLGVVRRAFTGGIGTVAGTAVRLGARSEVPVGGSGVTLGVTAALYAAGGDRLRGREAESWVAWSPPRGARWGLRAGYRAEQATARVGGGNSGNDRVEELHGWTAGVILRMR